MEEEKDSKPKFHHGQIVECSSAHFSRDKYWTRLIDPRWFDSRGWCYGENYIDQNGRSSGCGYSFEEGLFQEITDPLKRIEARRLELKLEIDELKGKLRVREVELDKLTHALNIAGIEGY